MRQQRVDCCRRRVHIPAAAQRVIDTVMPHIRHAADTKQAVLPF
jgi:hypothetical protein